jgi:hypothetical protein
VSLVAAIKISEKPNSHCDAGWKSERYCEEEQPLGDTPNLPTMSPMMGLAPNMSFLPQDFARPHQGKRFRQRHSRDADAKTEWSRIPGNH